MPPKADLYATRSQKRIDAILIAITIAILVLIATSSARAASGTWIGNATANWSNTASWTGGIVADGAGNTANFTFDITPAAGITVHLDTNRTIGIINVGDTGSNFRSYVIDSTNSSVLTLDNSGSNAQINKSVNTANDTISAPISLLSSLDLTNSSAGTLILSGGITAGSLGTKTIDAKSGTVTISGVVGDGTGTVAVTKSGTGTLNLGGGTADNTSNTYTGLTTISGGTVNLNKGTTGTNIAIAGDVLINGGTLQYGTTENEQIANTSNVTLSSGTFDLGARTETINSLTMTGGALLRGGTGQLTLSSASSITGGTLTFSAADSRINTTGTLALGGATFNFTSASNSTQGLVLGGDITYAATNTAPATFNNTSTGVGRINLGGVTRTFDIADSTTLAAGTAEVQIAWSIQNGSLTKSGTGTLSLSGANTYTGTTTITGGVLNATANGALGSGALTGTTAIAVNSGGILLLSNTAATDRVRDTATLNLAAGNGTVGSGGKLVLGATADTTSTSETLGAVTLNNNALINFASTSASSGFNITFSGVGASTLTATSANFVEILNWNGTIGTLGTANTDRLIFANGLNTFTAGSFTDQILFNISGTFYYTEFLSTGVGLGLEAVPFAPVPEPSTWVGAALAVAAVGFTQRKRFAKRSRVLS